MVQCYCVRVIARHSSINTLTREYTNMTTISNEEFLNLPKGTEFKLDGNDTVFEAYEPHDGKSEVHFYLKRNYESGEYKGFEIIKEKVEKLQKRTISLK